MNKVSENCPCGGLRVQSDKLALCESCNYAVVGLVSSPSWWRDDGGWGLGLTILCLTPWPTVICIVALAVMIFA